MDTWFQSEELLQKRRVGDGEETWYNLQMHYDYQGGLSLVTKTESDESLIKKTSPPSTAVLLSFTNTTLAL